MIKKSIQLFRISVIAASMSGLIIALKYGMHAIGFEPIAQSSLHNGVLASATFVIGFLLSATIADYKESERIPSEFAANLEDIYEDARIIHTTYPGFNIEGLRKQLLRVVEKFDSEVRNASRGVSEEIRKLNSFFAEMEQAGVPANFIVKLKQQQVILLRLRKRITYIQRIQFIPSATILARSIVMLVIGLLVFTNVEPFYGSLTIIGIVSFVLIYMMLLLKVISTPFHAEGKTRDDVSLFLITSAQQFLESGSKNHGENE